MINKAILVGNLGADPELRYTQGGTAVATLSLATTRRWKDKQGSMQDETEWHKIVCWAGQAEFCNNYLKKGMKVYVEGRITTRKWQDQNGNDRWSTEIVAETVQNLTPKQGGGQGDDEFGSTGDDVPF